MAMRKTKGGILVPEAKPAVPRSSPQKPADGERCERIFDGASYLRDVWRFLEELEKQRGCLVSVVNENPRPLMSRFTIRYIHDRDIQIEVWC